MKKILVIEDSLVSQSLIFEILNDTYQLVFQGDGAGGLRAAREQRPDLILLDIKMPKMDGYEVCRILKGDDGTRNIPIIFITSLDSESEKVKGFDAGADDYVVKPFYRQELIARIRAQISVHEAMQKDLMLARLTVFKEMAVSISHEINNPLTTVYAYLHVLQKDLADSSDTARTAIAGIREEVTRIHGIIGKMTDCTKVNSVRYNRDVTMIDLNDL